MSSVECLIKCPESLRYYAQSGDVHGLIPQGTLPKVKIRSLAMPRVARRISCEGGEAVCETVTDIPYYLRYSQELYLAVYGLDSQ